MPTTASINARTATSAASLCCLIPETMYSMLDVDDAVGKVGLDAGNVAPAAELTVEPVLPGGTVVSNSAAPSRSRLSSLNSIATSLIDWYRSSGSFARQRRTIRCRSIGADGFVSLIGGAGA